MVRLGSMFEAGESGLKKSEEKALELYRKAANLGEPRAMTYLGDFYRKGQGGLGKSEEGRRTVPQGREVEAACDDLGGV